MIEWKQDYSVSVASIDDDYKKLIAIINQLLNAMTKGEGAKVLAPLIDELYKYTVYHFNREETYFRMTNYANTDMHIKEHAYFVNKIKEFKDRVSAGNVSFSPDLFSFLRDWLLKHITLTDKMYSDHFLKSGLR